VFITMRKFLPLFGDWQGLRDCTGELICEDFPEQSEEGGLFNMILLSSLFPLCLLRESLLTIFGGGGGGGAAAAMMGPLLLFLFFSLLPLLPLIITLPPGPPPPPPHCCCSRAARPFIPWCVSTLFSVCQCLSVCVCKSLVHNNKR